MRARILGLLAERPAAFAVVLAVLLLIANVIAQMDVVISTALSLATIPLLLSWLLPR